MRQRRWRRWAATRQRQRRCIAEPVSTSQLTSTRYTCPDFASCGSVARMCLSQSEEEDMVDEGAWLMGHWSLCADVVCARMCARLWGVGWRAFNCVC
eukprot:892229-Rhodomonas_salina.2